MSTTQTATRPDEVDTTLAEAFGDISRAKADLISVMEVVRDLPSELKTGICSAMESAVDRVTAAEARLVDAREVLRSSNEKRPSVAPPAPASASPAPAVTQGGSPESNGLWMFAGLLAAATVAQLAFR